MHVIRSLPRHPYLIPASAPPQLRAAFAVFFLAAVVLWSIAGAAFFRLLPREGVVNAAAATALTIAAVCWVNAVRIDAERRALLRLIAEMSGGTPTPSLRRAA